MQHRKEVLAMIKDDKGTPQDKLRLFLIYFMSQKRQMEKDELEEFERALKEACGPESLTTLNYFKK